MYQYDVAISYASEIEKEIQKLVYYLEAEELKVFFFPQEQRRLLSENPYKTLYKIFEKESLVKVLFITEGYLNSEWTKLERRRAISSARENPRCLIVVNGIGEKLDEELKKYTYMNLPEYMDEAASWIVERVRELKNLKGSKTDKNASNIIIKSKGIVTGDNAVIHDITFY